MDVKEYFRILDEEVAEQYKIAGAARAKGLDPSTEVEAQPTRNLAERVEGLVGPKYIADEIKKCQAEKLPREKIVERIIDWILKGTYLKDLTKEQKIEQALRTAMAILTEGVVSAPLEGISAVKIEKNPDGSNYLGIYFAGPIRGAGGTASALSVLLGDYIRRKVGVSDYRPTDTEIERYKEEIKIYHRRIVRLQYMPSDEEIELILRNVPVCIDGDPTEKIEVDLHKGLERVKTDRVRGGVCLVIGEGIAQKAKKVLKFADAINLDGWEWLKDLKKGSDAKPADGEGAVKEVRPNKKFLEDIVAGRPIFAYPSRPGAWRLRYGRSNMCGIASKAIHPACMQILDEFPVMGTQMRVERPGKGMIAVPCAEMDAPVIKDKAGNVRVIRTVAEAKKVFPDVVEILFLGDMLVSFGDFLNYNEPLVPSGYVDEWWEQEYKRAGGTELQFEEIRAGEERVKIPGNKAVELSKKHTIPLHPKYTPPWHDLTVEELNNLVEWFDKSLMDFDFAGNKMLLKNDKPDGKRALELLLIPHTVSEDLISVEDYAIPLLTTLGALDEEKPNFKKAFEVIGQEGNENAFEAIQKTSPITIRKKVGCYIGARMGRPEKAKERMMVPMVHTLFPVGDEGGATRNFNKAAINPFIRAEVARMRCSKCKKLTFISICPDCGTRTHLEYKCNRCGLVGEGKMCKSCKIDSSAYEFTEIPIRAMLANAHKNAKQTSNTMLKGIKTLSSAAKIPEALEKGILRLNNGVSIFKDGTIRYDGTDIPTTHFTPANVHTSIERLKELGYEKDIRGKPIENKNQIIELMVQDVIVPTHSLPYLTGICNFVDDELEILYGLNRYYNIKKKDDLTGQLILGLAPHTSAAILGRIIGHTDIRGILAHPFWHSAKRRNCDGDEDAIMFLMDVLLNFSYSYLPDRRGGKMDAPLVVNTNLDPNEVDSEAHCMETGFSYSIEFYEQTQEIPSPNDVKIDIIGNHLEGNPYHIGLTKFSDWTGVPTTSKYVQLGDMAEKTDIELKLCKIIRAADVADVAKRLINSHLIRDTYGNMRAFARQKFRCIKCNNKYRRPPLLGKCDRCGGRVILTVSQGTVVKYVNLTDSVVKQYVHEDYMKQRMDLIKMEIKSVFENDKVKQFSLSEFA